MANGLKQMQRKHTGRYINGTAGFGDTVRGREQTCVIKGNKGKTYAHLKLPHHCAHGLLQ